MKAWGGDDARPGDDREDTLRAIEEAGIDLDPAGGRDGDDHDHTAHPHSHPHQQSAPGEPPIIGIVGAGAVGTALGVALDRAGWPIHAVASRDPGRRDRFRGLVPGARGFDEATPLVEEVELIILAVPDDAIRPVASGLHMYGGQAMIHTSGLVGAEALSAAMAAGTQVGSFHPLVAFADLERAVAALHGATVAIEGDDQLVELLARMAEAHRRDARPARRGIKARLPRRCGPRRGRLRCAPRRDRRARTAGRPRRGGQPRDLRPLDRADARQRPGARDRCRPDRSGDPRRSRHGGGARRGAGATRSRGRRALRPPRRPGDRDRRTPWLPDTGSRGRPASGRAPGACNAGLKRYHCRPWSEASPRGTRPVRRRDSSSHRPGRRERRLGLGGLGSFHPASTRLTVLRRPGDGILAQLRGDWRAVTAARPRRAPDGRPRPMVAYRWTGSVGVGSTRRSSAATAPWRG